MDYPSVSRPCPVRVKSVVKNLLESGEVLVFDRVSQFAQCRRLDLSDAFAGQVEAPSDLFECFAGMIIETESADNHFLFFCLEGAQGIPHSILQRLESDLLGGMWAFFIRNGFPKFLVSIADTVQ